MTWFLPSDLRESVAGDLEEEYRAIRARRGRVRAAVWFWWQSARLAWLFQWERATRGRGLPPIGDEIRRTNMWDSLRQDLLFGARMLRRQPGFTVVALIALTLGIGANTAIFSVVDAVLWRSLPFPDGEALVAVAESRVRENRPVGPVSPPDFVDWRAQNRSFTAIASYEPAGFNLTGGGEPERVQALMVSPGFLTVLGLPPVNGRDFRPEEETAGRERVVVLTDAFWRRRFGADPAVVGRTVQFSGAPFEVIGILPARFWWPTKPDVLVPEALADNLPAMRASHTVSVVARVKPGVTIEQARADMDAIGQQLSGQYPNENTGHLPNVVPLRRVLVGDVRGALLVLLGAVGLVLLIACANVATLMLARASSRTREIAIRAALGAGRARLVRQMLTESVLLGVLGGALGVAAADWILRGLRAILPAQLAALPGIDRVGVDLRVLAVALAITMGTAVIFGLVPALAASHQEAAPALHEEGRGGVASVRGRRVRAALVVAEMALSLMLLVGAALLIVSFKRLMDVPPGFRSSGIVTTQLALPANRYGDAGRTLAFYDALFQRLRAMPGVQAVAGVSTLPFTDAGGRTSFTIEGRTTPSSIPVRAHPRLVTPGYFQTMGVPLVRGRYLTERDGSGQVDVVVINETLAKRHWPGEDPIGQRMSFNVGPEPRWRQIVGVSGDVKHQGLDLEPVPEAFVPHTQPTYFSARAMSVVIRTESSPAVIAPMVRVAVAELDRDLPIGPIRAIDELITRSVAPRRLNFLLVSAFALVAVVLTAAGLYGVMAYLVVQRTREIGVRMALGASPRSVLGLVLRQAAAMTAVGIALGLAGALGLSRFLTTLLFGVRANDPAVYVEVSVLLAAVAFLAVAIPSRRATRVDPLIALRQA